MRSLCLIFALSALSCFAKAPSEEIYSCSEAGKVTTRVFFDPSVYCENNESHEAVLLRESIYGATLFKGTLKRTENDKGEVFVYDEIIDGLVFNIKLTLPYEMGKGIFLSTYDRDVQIRSTLDCVMKQVHVDCDN